MRSRQLICTAAVLGFLVLAFVNTLAAQEQDDSETTESSRAPFQLTDRLVPDAVMTSSADEERTEMAGATTVHLSATSLSFGYVEIGSTSAAKVVYLKNVGTSTLFIASIVIEGTDPGDFAQTHNCSSSLAAGATCHVKLTFKPAASGTRTAVLAISDNAEGSPQQVSLTGIGYAGSCAHYGQQCGSPYLPKCCPGLTCDACGDRGCCF